MTGDGWYDATAREPSAQPSLADLTSRQATWNLDAALARVDELTADAEDDEVPEELLPLLDQVTRDPEAPLQFRSLGRRVREGRTTWQAWWRDPTGEAGGADLFRTVFRLQLQQARLAARQTPDGEDQS